ncbi:MAG: hypothetical protein ACI9PY_000609 [Ascidiaceihabitans sp.]|jgi:hypothetical protein
MVCLRGQAQVLTRAWSIFRCNLNGFTFIGMYENKARIYGFTRVAFQEALVGDFEPLYPCSKLGRLGNETDKRHMSVFMSHILLECGVVLSLKVQPIGWAVHNTSIIRLFHTISSRL